MVRTAGRMHARATSILIHPTAKLGSNTPNHCTDRRGLVTLCCFTPNPQAPDSIPNFAFGAQADDLGYYCSHVPYHITHICRLISVTPHGGIHGFDE